MDSRVAPDKTLAEGSLDFYNTRRLEPVADELGTIWGNVRDYSSFPNGVEKEIASSCSIAGGSLIRGNLKRYWAMEAAQTTRYVINALKKPLEFQKMRWAWCIFEWDLAPVLIFCDHLHAILLKNHYLANERRKSKNLSPKRKCQNPTCPLYRALSGNPQRPPARRVSTKWIWASFLSNRRNGQSSANIVENRRAEFQFHPWKYGGD